MTYLLDTNIVSYWMRGEAQVVSQIRSRRPRELAIALITYAEISYGILKSADRRAERRDKLDAIASLIDILPMDMDAARHYAEIRVALEEQGTVISERDLQIASVSRAAGLTLVTHNTREFFRVPELSVEDWR